VLSTRRFAAPIAALILALTPTAALAQSSGDDQYSDPFGDEQSQSSGGSGGSGGSGSSGSAGSGSAPSASSGSAAQAAPSTAAPAATAASGTAAAEGGQLPRTGLDAGLVAAIGAGLLGIGFVLRRRTADARR
jgi:LPXTG-motif cell wall-anchored protein